MNDIEFLIDTIGDTVKINDIDSKALITHSNVTKQEERYIHTMTALKQGDLITYENERYLVVTETVTKRANKYKALIRHCNYSLEYPGETRQELMLDKDGKPLTNRFGDEIYITVEGKPVTVHTIIENSSFAINGVQLMVGINQIIVTVQNNKDNSDKLKVNTTFNVMDNKWKVLNVDKSQKGLLIITCEKTI